MGNRSAFRGSEVGPGPVCGLSPGAGGGPGSLVVFSPTKPRRTDESGPRQLCSLTCGVGCVRAGDLEPASFRGNARSDGEAWSDVDRRGRVGAGHSRVGQFRITGESTLHRRGEDTEFISLVTQLPRQYTVTYGEDIKFPSLRLVLGCFWMISSCPSKVFRYCICCGEGTGMRFGSLTPAVAVVVAHELAVLNCCFCCAID